MFVIPYIILIKVEQQIWYWIKIYDHKKQEIEQMIKKYIYYTTYNIDSSGTTIMILSNMPTHMKAKNI